MLNEILSQAPVFLLIFARIFAMLLVLPMFSMRSASRVAKVALAGYMAFFIFGTCDLSYYLPYIAQDGSFSMEYFLILIC